MDGNVGLGGSEAGGLGDAGYGPSAGPDYGGGNYNAGNYSASVAGYGINESLPGMGASPTGPMHSPGLSYATLNVLNDIGLGKMDIPGFNQNIEQALAAQNVHNVLNYAVPAFVNLVPGYGLMSSIGRGISTAHALIDGRLTPAQAFPSLAGAFIGAKTGIPSGILEGLFEGNLGKAAGAGAQAGLGALASNFGPAGSLAYGLSGIGPSFGKAVSDAVGGSRGGAPSSSSGSLSGLLGGSSAPSQGSAPTGNASGDVGISPDTYAVTAAIEQAAQEFKQPTREREMVAGRYGPIMNYEFGA